MGTTEAMLPFTQDRLGVGFRMRMYHGPKFLRRCALKQRGRAIDITRKIYC